MAFLARPLFVVRRTQEGARKHRCDPSVFGLHNLLHPRHGLVAWYRGAGSGGGGSKGSQLTPPSLRPFSPACSFRLQRHWRHQRAAGRARALLSLTPAASPPSQSPSPPTTWCSLLDQGRVTAARRVGRVVVVTVVASPSPPPLRVGSSGWLPASVLLPRGPSGRAGRGGRGEGAVLYVGRRQEASVGLGLLLRHGLVRDLRDQQDRDAPGPARCLPPPLPLSLGPSPPPPATRHFSHQVWRRGSCAISLPPCTPSGRNVPQLLRSPPPSASGCSIQGAPVRLSPILPPTWGTPIFRRACTASCPLAGGHTQRGNPLAWPIVLAAASKTCHRTKELHQLPPGRTSLWTTHAHTQSMFYAHNLAWKCLHTLFKIQFEGDATVLSPFPVLIHLVMLLECRH